MAIQNFQRTTHSLVSSLYYRTHHRWAWNSFQTRGSQMAGKCYVEHGFYKYQSDFANLLSRIYRKYVRHSFVSRVYYEPTMVGLGKNFFQ